MPENRYSPEELKKLQGLTVPTLLNAIETFGVIPNNEGYNSSTLRCHYPQLGTMVGYVVTARISTDLPATGAWQGVDEHEYWRWIASQPGPKIAAVQDISSPPRGAMWGEWNSNVHRALGCVGMVTEGAARDIDAVEKYKFHFFSTCILPSHANGVFIDYGGPVRVAGLELRTGDLIVGDLHGIARIPPEIPLDELCQVAEKIDRLESEIFRYCQCPDFNVEDLIRVDRSVAARWPRPTGVKRGQIIR